MFKQSLFGSICLALVLTSAASSGAANRQELGGSVPHEVKDLNLQPVGRLPASQHLTLGIALPLRNKADLGKLLKQIYDPASPRFHHYLTVQENAERFGATEADQQAVVDFLKAQGLTVTQTYSNRVYVSVDGTVENIEKAFHLTMRVYPHPTEARTFYAPDVEPSLDLNVPVLGINGLSNFHLPRGSLQEHPRGLRVENMNGSGPGSNYQGNDFRFAYAPGVSNTGAGQIIGLWSGGTAFSPHSIYVYETNCNLSTNIVVRAISVGGFDTNYISTSNDGEQCLDIEMCISMAPGAQVWEYESGDLGAVLSQMQSDMVKQCSTSITILPPPTNGEEVLQMMALQGQSFFVAAGDHGAYSAYVDYGVFTNDVIPWPDYSTNATVVGGTDLQTVTRGGGWQSETAWQGSGGGICTNSTLFVPIPLFQTGLNMTANQGSTALRNIPDVAMVGAGFWLVFSNAQVQKGVDGTSGSSPLWAGFMALVNEQAANESLPAIGFLNPAIYDIGKRSFYTNAFHDITVGNNTNDTSPTLFFATPGYDLCTGWGSPNGQGMINALVGYAGPVFVDFNSGQDPPNGNGSYYYPFKTLAEGTNAVSDYCTIFIETAGSSSETMKISKPMRIAVLNGVASIGSGH